MNKLFSSQIVLFSALVFISFILVSPTVAKQSEEEGSDKDAKSKEEEIVEATKSFTISEDGTHVFPASGINNKTTEPVNSFGGGIFGVPLFGIPITPKKDTKEFSMKFLLFTQKNKKIGQIINYETEVSNTNWDAGQNTVFIIHGFTQPTDEDIIKHEAIKPSLNIKNAYMNTSRKENIVVVDWKSAPHPIDFHLPGKSTTVLGEVLAHMIISLKVRKFLSYSQIKLVGFSLGAQICGVAGWFINENLDIKIPQITGLDPAGSGFDDKTDLKYRLDKTDAEFVDVIHTSQLGTTSDAFHALFYPNGGLHQHGCELKDGTNVGSCSHIRATQLYASTVRGREYRGCECLDAVTFANGGCNKCKGPFMGDLCPKDAFGKYYLKAEPEDEDNV